MDLSRLFNHRHFIFIASVLMLGHTALTSATEGTAATPLSALSKQLAVGDVIFIQVSPYPFLKVASTTHSWVNHVGIVVDVSGDQPVIAESTVPFSTKTTLSKFVARSGHGQVAVSRLMHDFTVEEQQQIRLASEKRLGIHYDTGFNLHSKGEFCSRFVREVIDESTGIKVGDVETFRMLLDKNPQADLKFWRVWYFGHIPWERETVTPASLYRSRDFKTVFDGYVIHG